MSAVTDFLRITDIIRQTGRMGAHPHAVPDASIKTTWRLENITLQEMIDGKTLRLFIPNGLDASLMPGNKLKYGMGNDMVISTLFGRITKDNEVK